MLLRGAILLLLLTVVAGGLIQGRTHALLSSTASVPSNAFDLKTLTAPTGLTANPLGHTVQTSWTAANGDAYKLTGGASGTDNACTTVTYGVIASPAVTNHTDSRFTPEGNYFCYKIQSTQASWESVASAPVSAQLGFVTATISIAGVGNPAHRVSLGDIITINFNQAVDTTSGPSATDTVCSDNNLAILVLGSTTTTGSCDSSTEIIKVGTITTDDRIRNDARYDATYAWSNANKTLTITIGTQIFGSKATEVKGNKTLTPASTLLEAAAANGICTSNAGGGDCLPLTADNF